MSKVRSNYSLVFLIKILAAILLSVMGLAALFGSAGAYLTWLAARDAKLMALHDRGHESKLAMYCGNKGVLVRDAASLSHACMYVNKDGEMLFVEVPSAPLVASRGIR
jgi:hypothetical protein